LGGFRTLTKGALSRFSAGESDLSLPPAALLQIFSAFFQVFT
jgi:hypothetical protein